MAFRLNNLNSNAKCHILSFLDVADLRNTGCANKGLRKEATKPHVIAKVLGFNGTDLICKHIAAKTLYISVGDIYFNEVTKLNSRQIATLNKAGYEHNNNDDILFVPIRKTNVVDFATGKIVLNENLDFFPFMLPKKLILNTRHIHLALNNKYVVIETLMIEKGDDDKNSTDSSSDTLGSLEKRFYLGHLKKLEAPKSAESDKKENAKS